MCAVLNKYRWKWIYYQHSVCWYWTKRLHLLIHQHLKEMAIFWTCSYILLLQKHLYISLSYPPPRNCLCHRGVTVVGPTLEAFVAMFNHQKDKFSHVLLDPVADYVYMADLNIRLHVSWKTLPNLNFKLKFQTQISNSNLNFKTKVFPILPGNPVFWEIDSKGKRNEINKAMTWSLGEVMSWSRGSTEGF